MRLIPGPKRLNFMPSMWNQIRQSRTGSIKPEHFKNWVE
ncbi:hypothetical protein ACNKHT_25840 [Shigella flexneri]